MLWFSISLETPSAVTFLPDEQAFKGGIWHGMFEAALLRTGAEALLAQLIDGRDGHGRARYAIFPPLDQETLYPAGTQIKWALVLYGDGCLHWRDILAALLAPGALRLGRQRKPVHIRKIEALHPHRLPAPIYDMEDDYFEEDALPIPLIENKRYPARQVGIRTITPVNITSAARNALGLAAEPVSLARWVKALRARLSELEPQLARQFDFKGHAWQSQEHALRDVGIVHADIARFQWPYRSRTKKHPVMMEGHIGTTHFAGDIAPGVHALLEFGQWLGIGQKTSIGQGWYGLVLHGEGRDAP